jgi:hypothetical protein
MDSCRREAVLMPVSHARPDIVKVTPRYAAAVSTRVNLVANDDTECNIPVDLPAATATFFRLIEGRNSLDNLLS